MTLRSLLLHKCMLARAARTEVGSRACTICDRCSTARSGKGWRCLTLKFFCPLQVVFFLRSTFNLHEGRSIQTLPAASSKRLCCAQASNDLAQVLPCLDMAVSISFPFEDQGVHELRRPRGPRTGQFQASPDTACLPSACRTADAPGA